MTGYQEMLTDPSYAGQILVCTYPLVGNYGVNAGDFESRRVQVSGFVVREWCPQPSHALSQHTLHEFLASQGVSGISGVDTRAVARRLRTRGVMMGAIAIEMAPDEALERLRAQPPYEAVNYVARVTAPSLYRWDEVPPHEALSQWRIVVTDWGLKYNILRLLHRRGCEVIAVPSGTSADQILELNPDGVVLSPGPGDPALLGQAVATVRALMGHVPVMGICLGHQVLALALGGRTYKLKFGHRGANHPVKELQSGLVSITAQNHGYAVDPDSLPPELEVSHVNLNDGTVEGLRHRSLPVLSIQFHSEASPGPRDNEHLFDRFLKMVQETV
jgi:carbamoyl-phosphate synthase small subunit